MFVFRSHNITAAQLVEVAERSFNGMLRIIAETEPPFVANIVRSGDIRLLNLPD